MIHVQAPELATNKDQESTANPPSPQHFMVLQQQAPNVKYQEQHLCHGTNYTCYQVCTHLTILKTQQYSFYNSKQMLIMNIFLVSIC